MRRRACGTTSSTGSGTSARLISNGGSGARARKMRPGTRTAGSRTALPGSPIRWGSLDPVDVTRWRSCTSWEVPAAATRASTTARTSSPRSRPCCSRATTPPPRLPRPQLSPEDGYGSRRNWAWLAAPMSAAMRLSEVLELLQGGVAQDEVLDAVLAAEIDLGFGVVTVAVHGNDCAEAELIVS